MVAVLSKRIFAFAVLVAVSSCLASCSAISRVRDAATEPTQVSAPATYDTVNNPDMRFVRTKTLDVAYSTESSAQTLDIYLPEAGMAPYPVVVAIHGGSFKWGDKSDGQIAPMLSALGRGYAVVSINYRLMDEAKWPAQLEDAKAAIRFLRAHAVAYELDPNRMAAWGDSAGGELAALLGTTGGVIVSAGSYQSNGGQSDRVQAVVDWFGPIDSGALASISPDAPPFLIEHGTNDRTVWVEQSKRLAAALTRTLGAEKVTLKLFDGAGHLDPVFASRQNLDFVLDWLDAHLK